MEKERIFKATVKKPPHEIVLSTGDYIKFICDNSDMDWNEVCKFIYEKGYLTHDYGTDYIDPEEKPKQDRIDDHGYDYEYEFAKAHPWSLEVATSFVFDD